MIGKNKKVGEKGHFYVKLSLNSKVCKKAGIKGKDKITNSFTVKVSKVNIADVMALEGQNFKGSRNGVEIVK